MAFPVHSMDWKTRTSSSEPFSVVEPNTWSFLHHPCSLNGTFKKTNAIIYSMNCQSCQKSLANLLSSKNPWAPEAKGYTLSNQWKKCTKSSRNTETGPCTKVTTFWIASWLKKEEFHRGVSQIPVSLASITLIPLTFLPVLPVSPTGRNLPPSADTWKEKVPHPLLCRSYGATPPESSIGHLPLQSTRSQDRPYTHRDDGSNQQTSRRSYNQWSTQRHYRTSPLAPSRRAGRTAKSTGTLLFQYYFTPNTRYDQTSSILRWRIPL